MASGSSMDSDRKDLESPSAVAYSISEIIEVPLPDQPSSPSAGGSVNTVGNDRDDSSKDEVRGLHKKIQNDLSHFKSTLESWRQRADELGKQVSRMIKESQDSKHLAPHGALKDKLREVQLEISSLRLHLPALHNPSKAKSSTSGLPKVVEDEISGQMLAKLEAEFKKTSRSPIIQGVRQLYGRLDWKRQKCLLCLTAFPENAIIKKRVLINWWVGEEFLDVQGLKKSMAIEKAAEDIFKELGEKGFIMLVHKKGKWRSPVPDSCQLHPFMRWVLITLAREDKFLDFDSQGNAMREFSSSSRACLVEGGQSPSKVSGNWRLRTLFNVNEQFIDLRLDSFYLCRVLQLGRWVVSPDHSIDVDDAPSLLRGIGMMKSLRYLSLQGVTRIGTLPASICKLHNLTILDLGACQSLETLPKEIGSLGELRYLDFSECYLISHMPKSLMKLEKLQVLKGFVLYHRVNHQNKSKNPCTLSDLAEMKKLWKLSLRMDKAADLGDEHIRGLSELPELKSLTITWIRAPKKSLESPRECPLESTNSENSSSQHKPLPRELMKLDLRGYPRTSMPTWVTPSEVKNLKKLYIRGGNLANLNWDSPPGNPSSVKNLNWDSHSDNRWSVKILRLKFLANCEIEWLDLRDHFPSLVYLEKFQCPKLKFFPCDSYGVWMDPHAREEDRQTLREILCRMFV